MKSTVVRIRLGATAIMVASLLALGACASSPTSTYTNAEGQSVTVDWKDYPVHAGTLPGDVLAAPVKEDAEAISAALLHDVTTALAAEFGLDWEASGERGWFPNNGNSYGGRDMTTTYNSVEWTSNTAPSDTADWEKIVAITSRITLHHGLGPVQLGFDKETFKNDNEWQKDLVRKYGTADPQKLWWWDGTAYTGSQWLALYVVNVDRDTTGAAAKEYAESGFQPRTISLSYGATTVARADRAALEAALAPFTGLTPPEATTSD